jgi:hypothetical protein
MRTYDRRMLTIPPAASSFARVSLPKPKARAFKRDPMAAADTSPHSWHEIVLQMEHHTCTRLDEFEFVADRSIKQAFTTQAPSSSRLRPRAAANNAWAADEEDFERLIAQSYTAIGPTLIGVRIDDKPGTGTTRRDPVQIRERFMPRLGVRQPL